jgi:hypothetical protein
MEQKKQNAADEAQVKEAGRKGKELEDQNIADMKWVLSSQQGIRVIARYLEFCGVHKISADASGSWTYFNEGKRNIGLKMLADIEKSKPEAYLEIRKHKELDNV